MMSKSIKIIAILSIVLLTFTACKSESKNDINEFINELNVTYGYNLKSDDFFAEKKENLIYHSLTDNNTLFSLYSNKNGEIIQCTLSSFDTKNENNYKLLTETGAILTTETKESFEVMLENANKTGRYSQNGWTVTVIRNNIATTYIINQTTNKINKNGKPETKDFIKNIN